MRILGIDVAKATLEVAVWQDGQVQSLGAVANTPEGWEALARQVDPPRGVVPGVAAAVEDVRVVLEPTGGYELGVALWASQRGWLVVRPNPRHVRDWARSQGRRAKTDRQDAVVLA